MENKEKQEKKQLGNKGFSLVELIVVMAIMAILVGIVGSQVIPYIEKSKEAKDYQVMAGFCTAAVSAYTELAEEVPGGTTTIYLFNKANNSNSTTFEEKFCKKVIELSYTQSDFKKKMKSKKGAEVLDFEIKINTENKTITVTAMKKGTTGDKADTAMEEFAPIIGEL